MDRKMEDTGKLAPKEQAAHVLGNKWAFWVIGELSAAPKRFHELRRALRTISLEMLSEVLLGLEQLGIVHRRANPVMPNRLEYALTESGIDYLHAYFYIHSLEEQWLLVPPAMPAPLLPPEDYRLMMLEQEDSP